MELSAATAENPEAPAAKIATAYIIWIVRIALPIIFFWIWYRTQPEKPSWYSQPHEISRSRDELLQVRKAVASSVSPKSLAGMRVSDEAALPECYRARPASRGGAKKDSHAKRVEETLPALVQRSSGPSSSEPGKRGPGSGAVKCDGIGAAEAKEQEQRKLLADEEQMQFKSMLNYVTFSHKERPQRVFLPDTGQPPPPPKKAEADTQGSMKANADAQAVLKCAANRKFDFKLSDISKSLYHGLSESRVPISEATLSLMAESCANVGDLKGASDFLMKMEADGHCPDSALLDKVMDLFSEEKDAATDAAALVAGEQEEPDLLEALERELDKSEARTGSSPTSHPWSAAKAASPHPHALNFSAYSDGENDLSPR